LFYCSRQRFVALCKDLGRAFYLCRIRAYKNAGEYASDTIEKGFEHSRHKLAGKHLFQKSGYRSEHTVKQSCYELRGIISKRIEYLQDRPDKSAYLASKLSKSLADTITAFYKGSYQFGHAVCKPVQTAAIDLRQIGCKVLQSLRGTLGRVLQLTLAVTHVSPGFNHRLRRGIHSSLGYIDGILCHRPLHFIRGAAQ
jgi:hypothetical protein